MKNWYRDNIWKNGQNTKVTNLIADTPYCNDMSEITNGNRVNFGAYDRLITNKSPQYKCASSTYGYTVSRGDLTFPIGLLTVEEAAYAGAAYNVYNTTYYLYTKHWYWTISPSYFLNLNARIFGIGVMGTLGNNVISASNSVLPVISLKEEARVKRGTGVYNDPYVIMTE